MSPLVLARERVWHRTAFTVMGSIGELVLDAPAGMIPHAIARLRQLERAWSRFDPASELEQLHGAAGRWMPVSTDLRRALRWAARMHVETDALFDVRVREPLEAWGYDRTFREIDLDRSGVPGGEWSPPGTAPGFSVDDERGSATIQPGVRIDLGGIGKGLAADLLAAELLASGAGAAYVCLGGDIHAAGEPPEGGWAVPLVHPVTGARIATHVLQSGGLVMSTRALRRWRRGGVEAHHLIDPRTGAPAATDLVAVAVASRSSARGEALAKAALVAGRQAGRALLERAAVDAWLIGDDETETVGGCA